MLKGNVRRPSMRMKQVNQAVAKWTHQHHSLVWLCVRLRTNIHLRVAQTLRKAKKSTQIVSATQAKRLEMKWRLSCGESLLNLYKRQGATSMAQASSYVTITADSYPTTREWEVPKGQLYYSRTAQTLGTILVHNAERCHTQCSIALGTVVSLGSCEHGKELGPREQASRKKVLRGNHYRLERGAWRSSGIWHLKGLWGQQWPWWRWCHLGCRSSWSLVWREGRREGSRWQCSCHSQASGRRKRKCLAGRHQWCAPCCSDPATWGWPEDQGVR